MKEKRQQYSREFKLEAVRLLEESEKPLARVAQAHRHEFEISLMCRSLGVSRSGFYAWRKRPASERERRDQRLRLEIRAIHRESRQTYGSPRVHAELRARALCCGLGRVERLMRDDGLRARERRRFRRTTNSNHSRRIAPNVLERRFSVEEMNELDRVWVGDITYIPTREGWLYLAVLLDLASRSVVGWAMKATMERSLVLDALRMALLRRRPSGGLLHHSDRGVQYASADYQALLAGHDITCSMSRKGDCWDNAVAESFFATLEWELIQEADWHTREEAGRAIFEYIELWYNRRRKHSTLGYRSPAEYESLLACTTRAA